MQTRGIVLMIVLMMFIIPMAVPSSDATATVTVNNATISTFDDSAEIGAGGTYSLTVTVLNESTDFISVLLTVDGGFLNASLPTDEAVIDKGKMQQFTITVTTGRMAEHGKYDIVLTAKVYSFSDGSSDEGKLTFTVNLTSMYTDGSGYNRIMGIFPPLPEPFDSVAITVAITLAAWSLVSIAVFIIFGQIVDIILRNEEEGRESIKKITGSMLMVAIMLHAISNALDVAAAPDFTIAAAKNLTRIVYILIAAVIGWNVYHSFITIFFHRMEKKNDLEGLDSSLIPLFRMIGKLIITIAAASAILSTLGFSLTAILTGAGIVGLAVSLGAQNALTQFFGGVSILLTRPFKAGDMVSIGNDTNIYEVKKIGIMNTTFKNWANHEYLIMPNNTVSTSKIINVTGKTMAYRILLYFYSSYDTDTDLAKKVILETALKNPRVIQDGSYSYPYVRLEDFDPSSIKYRLAVYITDFRDNVKATGELGEAVYNALLDAGIECPFDIYDVYPVKQE